MKDKTKTPAEDLASKIRAKELVENPTVRTPLLLVLDISGSMTGFPLEQLNLGTKMLLHEILAHKKAQASVEVCVIVFDHEVQCIREFNNIKSEDDIPEMVTRGSTTCTGTAVHAALDKLEERKAEYAERGVEYYRPWMILISDGEPYGEDSAITESAIDRIASLTASTDLTSYTVGVGNHINQETLCRFSPENLPLHVDSPEQFHSLFKWLSTSVIQVASKKPYYAAPENVRKWQEFHT